jgi:cell division protein ZapA
MADIEKATERLQSALRRLEAAVEGRCAKDDAFAADLQLSINGRSYLISCDDGQEAHLKRLGAFLDEKMTDLATAVGNVGEARLLVMAALLISDELFEARRQQEGEEAGGIDIAAMEEAETTMAGALDAFAQRIEAIAARLEGA